MVFLELALALAPWTAEARPVPASTVVLVVGASGQPEFGERFEAQAGRWAAAAERGEAEVRRVDDPAAMEGDDRARLRSTLDALPRDGDAPLWVVLLGHGTFDGERARFNLRGPDVRALELAEWLAPFERPVAVIVCASSSGPFVNRLSAPGRVIVTATRSGAQRSYSYFGEHLSHALGDPAADLDADRQVSLLEAFRFASARTAEFYAGEARLATEHALLDDNGDQRGTTAGGFRGVRATRAPEPRRLPDGVRAHQLHLVPSARERAIPPEARAERDALELELEALRLRKSQTSEDAYYAELEQLMLELARLYERLDE